MIAVKAVKHTVSIFLLSLSLLAGFLSCNSKQGGEMMHASKSFPLPQRLINKIQVYTVKNQVVENELNPTSRVTFNEESGVKVFSPVNGQVAQVKAEIGQYVKKGQVLAIIQYKNIEKSTQPVVSQRAIDARTTYRQDMQDDNKNMKKSSPVYTRQQTTELAIKAPIDGFLVEKMVSPVLKSTQTIQKTCLPSLLYIRFGYWLMYIR